MSNVMLSSLIRSELWVMARVGLVLSSSFCFSFLNSMLSSFSCYILLYL